jgi:hypothetical protein
MKFKYFLLFPIFLTSCAHTQAVIQLEQGKQCWSNIKNNFIAANPNSPAAWYLSDDEPRPSDFINQSRATKLESQHLAYLTDAYDSCYTPAMQPTGDVRYDNLIRTASTATSLTYIEIARYANREINRGEYYRRYAAIKADFDNSKNQQISNIQQEQAAARQKFARALASGIQAGYTNGADNTQMSNDSQGMFIGSQDNQYDSEAEYNAQQKLRSLQNQQQWQQQKIDKLEKDKKWLESEKAYHELQELQKKYNETMTQKIPGTY